METVINTVEPPSKKRMNIVNINREPLKKEPSEEYFKEYYKDCKALSKSE